MNLHKLSASIPLGMVALLASFLALQPTSAFAATAAVATGNVNLRAGPATAYPVVTTLHAGARITTHGCLADNSWCDVNWGGNRGWVSASYIQVTYAGRPVMLSPAVIPVVGITVVRFNQTYWNAHYVGRPWYGNYNHYHHGADNIDRSVTRACGPEKCARRAVTTGPNGGRVVRKGIWDRP